MAAARRAGKVPARNAMPIIRAVTPIMSGIVYATRLKVGKLSRKPPGAWKAALAMLPKIIDMTIPKTEPQKPSMIASRLKLRKTCAEDRRAAARNRRARPKKGPLDISKH